MEAKSVHVNVATDAERTETVQQQLEDISFHKSPTFTIVLM